MAYILFLSSTFGWFITHYLITHILNVKGLHLKPNRSVKGEISSRRFAIKIISFIHSIFAFIGGIYVIHELTNGTMTELQTVASPSLQSVVLFEAGYYGYDFLSDIYRIFLIQRRCRWLDLTFFVHHIVPIVVFPAYSVWRQNKLNTSNVQLPFLDYVTALLLVTNVNTALTTFRWMRTVTGNVQSKLLNQAVVALYFVCRVGLWPWLLHLYRKQHQQLKLNLLTVLWSLPYRCSISTTILFLSNLYFWYLNVQKIL